MNEKELIKLIAKDSIVASFRSTVKSWSKEAWDNAVTKQIEYINELPDITKQKLFSKYKR